MLDNEQQIRVEALKIAMTTYPEAARLSLSQRDRARGEVFKLADKCAEYIRHGLHDHAD